jgi:hypothetical protein
MNLEQAKTDITTWIEEFLEVPNPALGGWSPCPYARRARLDGAYEVRPGQDVYWDLAPLSWKGIDPLQVVVYVYDADTVDPKKFTQAVDLANRHYMVPYNLIALLDHPGLPETVNGVSLNQGTYALVLVQSLPDLDQKAAAVGRKGFYDTWPDAYLKELFQHRQDPRP